MCCLPSAVIVAAKCRHRHRLLHDCGGGDGGGVDAVENIDIVGCFAGGSLSYLGRWSIGRNA